MHRYWKSLFALGLLAALPTVGAQPDPPPQKTEVQRDIDRQPKAFRHDATATSPSRHGAQARTLRSAGNKKSPRFRGGRGLPKRCFGA